MEGDPSQNSLPPPVFSAFESSHKVKNPLSPFQARKVPQKEPAIYPAKASKEIYYEYCGPDSELDISCYKPFWENIVKSLRDPNEIVKTVAEMGYELDTPLGFKQPVASESPELPARDEDVDECTPRAPRIFPTGSTRREPFVLAGDMTGSLLIKRRSISRSTASHGTQTDLLPSFKIQNQIFQYFPTETKSFHPLVLRAQSSAGRGLHISKGFMWDQDVANTRRSAEEPVTEIELTDNNTTSSIKEPISETPECKPYGSIIQDYHHNHGFGNKTLKAPRDSFRTHYAQLNHFLPQTIYECVSTKPTQTNIVNQSLSITMCVNATNGDTDANDITQTNRQPEQEKLHDGVFNDEKHSVGSNKIFTTLSKDPVDPEISFVRTVDGRR